MDSDVGSNEYADDPTILDEELLLRRVLVKPRFSIIWDENMGCWRPSSVSFENHQNGSPMSVVLERLLESEGRTPQDVLTDHDGFALAAITVLLARDCGQGVVRAPLPEEPAHAEVFGEKPKSVKRKLAKGSVWVIPPDLEPPAGS